jgi:glycosyltransferase involved in cell wall biosynthesis
MPQTNGVPRPHKQRVALIGHAAEPHLFGAERSLVSIIGAIDRAHYEPCVFLPSSSNDQYLRTIEQYTDNLTVFSYSWWSGTRAPDAAAISRFTALFRSQRIDLVHSNTITLIDPLLAARQIGVPCIVHARELIDQDEYLAGLLGEDPVAIVARIRAAADFIIANSNMTHRLYHKEGRSFRLYNCIDTDAFDIANDLTPGRLKIGIISSNHPRKGIEHFVRLAILAARRQQSGLEFIVFGPHTGHTRDLSLLSEREDIPINLRFEGYIDDPLEAVRQINVVLSFSVVAESFGRTVAEAMAARRPVISYDRGAAPEFVRHGLDGFIIPPFDIEQALGHLEALAGNPARVAAMGDAGRARAIEMFAPAVFASGLNEIYRRVLEMRHAPRATG